MKLKDIAQTAGVSSATVSMVLHNKDGVSAEIRAKIEQLLRENGYEIEEKKEQHENSDTKSFRFLKYIDNSYLVDYNLGYISYVIDSVERECRRRGYNLLMTTVKKKNLEDVFQNLKKEKPDGVILLGTEWTDAECSYLKNLNFPIVVVDNNLTKYPVSCVSASPVANVYCALNYLYEKNYRDIGYLMSTEPSCNCLESYEAFKRISGEMGLSTDESNIFYVKPTFDGAYASMTELLKEKGRKIPSAIITNNDNLALGAMRALKEAGLRIPEDVAIMGSDDTAAAAMSDPPLTSLHPDCKRIGIWVVRLLCDQIAYPNMPVTKIHVHSTLVERKSTEKTLKIFTKRQ